MLPQLETPRGVLIRDFAIFQLKLALEGLKGLALIQLSIVAVVGDLVFAGRKRGRLFYSLLSVAERFDLWLNLYAPAERAQDTADGLFGASRAGDNSLLGELEALVRREEQAPAAPAPRMSTLSTTR